MEAASGGYVEVGRVLLDKGADIAAAPVPVSRDTALTIAADKGHHRFVELLLTRYDEFNCSALNNLSVCRWILLTFSFQSIFANIDILRLTAILCTTLICRLLLFWFPCKWRYINVQILYYF